MELPSADLSRCINVVQRIDNGLLLVNLTQGRTTTVNDSLDVIELLKAHRFCVVCNRGKAYAATNVFDASRKGGHKTAFLHNLLLGVKLSIKGIDVDHCNGDSLDNRKSNLRMVSHTMNVTNRHKASASSGVIGVSKTKSGWIAHWKEDGRTKAKCFASSVYGDSAKAKQAASVYRKYVEQTVPQYSESLPKESSTIMECPEIKRKVSKSGVKGVSRHSQDKGWTSYWRENSKHKSAFFGDSTHGGKEAAKDVAIEHHNEKMKELEQQQPRPLKKRRTTTKTETVVEEEFK